jgi:hypothetical protein
MQPSQLHEYTLLRFKVQAHGKIGRQTHYYYPSIYIGLKRLMLQEQCMTTTQEDGENAIRARVIQSLPVRNDKHDLRRR